MYSRSGVSETRDQPQARFSLARQSSHYGLDSKRNVAIFSGTNVDLMHLPGGVLILIFPALLQAFIYNFRNRVYSRSEVSETRDQPQARFSLARQSSNYGLVSKQNIAVFSGMNADSKHLPGGIFFPIFRALLRAFIYLSFRKPGVFIGVAI